MTIHMAPASLMRAWIVAACGGVSLAVVMGIGRFSYTSILPLMIHEGALDLNFGGTLASVNYLGYLVGAMLCLVIPTAWSSARLVRCALVATVLTTAGMTVPFAPLWLVLRLASGVISGIALVHTAKWCMGQLSAMRWPALGSAMFMGVGFGIALSGLAASVMIAAEMSWSAAWGGSAAVGAVLVGLVWTVISPADEVHVKARAAAPGVEQGAHKAKGRSGAAGPGFDPELWVFTLAYGLAGFGYIITATFLPVIARAALPPSIWLDLFWPIFGLAAAAGSLLVTRVHGLLPVRYLLAICHVMQGVGVMLATFWPSTAGFVLGSIVAGLPFTSINFLAMDDAHRMRPERPAQFIGLLTAAFAVGQIIGPPLVQVIMRHVPDQQTGFDLSLQIAGGALIFATGLYLFLARRYGLPDRPAH